MALSNPIGSFKAITQLAIINSIGYNMEGDKFEQKAIRFKY